MKKRFSAVLLSLIMAFTLLPAGAKAAQTVTLGAQDGRAVTGDVFEWAEFPVTASGFSEALTIDNTELSVMMYTDAAGTKGEASAADKGFSVSYYIDPLKLQLYSNHSDDGDSVAAAGVYYFKLTVTVGGKSATSGVKRLVVCENLESVVCDIGEKTLRNTTANIEYSLDGSTWNACGAGTTSVPSMIVGGTLSLRDKNDTAYTRDIPLVGTPDAPTLASRSYNSASKENIITLTAHTGYEYGSSINGATNPSQCAWQDSPTFTYSQGGYRLTFWQRVKAAGSSPASESSEGASFYTIPATPDAVLPEDITATETNISINASKSSSKYEYAITEASESAAPASGWITGTGAQGGTLALSSSLSPSTAYKVWVRVKEFTDDRSIVCPPSEAVSTQVSTASPIIAADYTIYYNSADGKLHIGSLTGTEYTGNSGKWTGSEGTLTLSGFNFTTSAATAMVLPAEIELVITGTNTVTSTYKGLEPSYGIYAGERGTLTVGGTGRLTVTGGETWQASSIGVFVNNGGLTVTGGTLSGVGGLAMWGSIGISAYPITVTGGTLSGTSGSGINTRGVSCNSHITVSGSGTLDGSGGAATTGPNNRSFGVYAYDGITVSGSGAISGIGGSAPYGNSFGVYCNTESIEVSGGTIFGTGGAARRDSHGVMGYNNCNISISGGTLYGTGGAANEGSSYGVSVKDGIITVSGGQLTAKTTSTAEAHHALSKELTLQNGMGAQASTNSGGANPVSYIAANNDTYKWVQTAVPSVVGDFTILGGTEGTDYSYESGVLTITGAGSYTIGMRQGITITAHRIAVNAGNDSDAVTFNLNGVNILAPQGQSALTIAQGEVTLMADGACILQGGEGEHSNTTLPAGSGGAGIDGSVSIAGGSLTALGGNGGNHNSSANICIGGNGGAGISGRVSVTGGSLTALGGSGGNASGSSYININGASGKGIGGTVSAAAGFAIKAGDSAEAVLTVLTSPAVTDKKYVSVSAASYYTVSYHSNSGVGVMQDGTAIGGAGFPLPDCAFIAPTGKQFKEWAIGSVSGTRIAAGGIYTFSDNTTVYAIWEEQTPTAARCTVSVSASPAAGGTAAGSGICNENTSVAVIANANSGFRFVRWTEGGGQVSIDSTYIFTITADRALTALFESDISADTLTILPNIGEPFTIRCAPADSIENVKQHIQDTKGYSPDNQSLTHLGTTLKYGKTLVDYNIRGGATLNLTIAQSAAPEADVTTEAKTAAIQPSISFTLTNSPPLDSTWKVYADETATNVHDTVSASVSGSVLTLTDSSGNILPKSYYISVTENGKAESVRLALTVTDYTPPAAKDLTISGGTEGTDYTYTNGVLTITGAGSYTIGMRQGISSTADRIAVSTSGAVTLTLNGVNILAPQGQSALTIAQGEVTLSAAEASTLRGGSGRSHNSGEVSDGGAGIFGDVRISSGALTVTGGAGGDNSKANSTAGRGGAGISGSVLVSGGEPIISGGAGGRNMDAPSATAIGGSGGNGIGGSVTVTGGSLVSTGGECGMGYGGNGASGRGVASTITADRAAFEIKAGDSADSALTAIQSGSSSEKKYIKVAPLKEVSFFHALANGSDTESTTQITLILGAPVVGLTVDDITLTGASKDTLERIDNSKYILHISNITVADRGYVSLEIGKTGYNFFQKQKDVQVRRYTPPAIAITMQPADQHVFVGQQATFTIAATGNGLEYQWNINRNDGNGWRRLDGATSPSYTTSPTDLSCDGFLYACHISDAHEGKTESRAAALHVSEVVIPPVTGDSSAPLLWLGLCLLGCAGMLSLAHASRRREQGR